MSKIERGQLLSREPLNAMSKGENAKTDRVLQDDELDAVSGGLRLQMATSGFRLADRSYLETMADDECGV